MAKTRRRRSTQAGTFEADKAVDYTRPIDKVKDEVADDRLATMKKEAEQKRQNADLNKVVDYYYELQGTKLIKKVRKANGSLYSYYVTNVRTNPEILKDPEISQHLKR